MNTNINTNTIVLLFNILALTMFVLAGVLLYLWRKDVTNWYIELGIWDNTMRDLIDRVQAGSLPQYDASRRERIIPKQRHLGDAIFIADAAGPESAETLNENYNVALHAYQQEQMKRNKLINNDIETPDAAAAIPIHFPLPDLAEGQEAVRGLRDA